MLKIMVKRELAKTALFLVKTVRYMIIGIVATTGIVTSIAVLRTIWLMLGGQ